MRPGALIYFTDTLAQSPNDSLQTDSTTTMLLRDTTSVVPSDTLPLFYQGQFVSEDSLQLTEYHSTQEYVSGFEGAPFPTLRVQMM